MSEGIPTGEWHALSNEIVQPEEDLRSIELHGSSLADWHRRLVTDPENGEPLGHLATPVSRYSNNADQAGWWALSCDYIQTAASGEPDDAEANLDYMCSLVVNDSPTVIWLVTDYWWLLPEPLREAIGGEDRVVELFAEAEEWRRS